MSAELESATSTGAISTAKQTYRRYVKFESVKDADGTQKTVIGEQRILAESDSKDKKTGLAVNWQTAENDGFVLFSENDVLGYTAKSVEGFNILVPTEEQRLYIINAGLSNIQTARANAFMKASKENTAEPEPEFSGITLDLRVGTDDEGTYSLNKAPTRKSLTEEEKLTKNLSSLNLSDDEIMKIMASFLAARAAKPAEQEEEVGAEA